jgi:G:T/U-mismatch repair DNA glycosylase
VVFDIIFNNLPDLGIYPSKITSRLEGVGFELLDNDLWVMYVQVPLGTGQSPAKVEGPPHRLAAKCVMDHCNMQTC